MYSKSSLSLRPERASKTDVMTMAGALGRRERIRDRKRSPVLSSKWVGGSSRGEPEEVGRNPAYIQSGGEPGGVTKRS